MTNQFQMATGVPEAECCHRRRFPEDGRAGVLANVRMPQGAVPGLRVVQVQGLPFPLQGASHACPRLLHDAADAHLLRLGAALEAEGRREAPHEPRPRQRACSLRHRGGGLAPRLREGGGDDSEPKVRGHTCRGQGVRRLHAPLFACGARRVLRREMEKEHQAGDGEVALLRRRRSPLLHRPQRERGQVAGLDGAAGTHAPALPPPHLGMEAQLLGRANGTARVEKPAFSGVCGIAMKNGGVKSTSSHSRTRVTERILNHYGLISMRSGMIVVLNVRWRHENRS